MGGRNAATAGHFWHFALLYKNSIAVVAAVVVVTIMTTAISRKRSND